VEGGGVTARDGTARGPWLVELLVFAVALAYVLIAPAAAGTRSSNAAQARQPTAMATPHGDGLSTTHDGYVISPVRLPTGRGPAVPVQFRILGPGGAPATAFQTVHTKPLHLYLVRDDLSGYQHLHPTLTGDTWSTQISITDGGAYRLYAEFTPSERGTTGHSTVLGLPFVIPGDTAFVPLPPPEAAAVTGGLRVSRADGVTPLRAGKSALMTFRVHDKAGQPVQLQPYLGAQAHASAFEALSQRLSHMHAAMAGGADGTITFHTSFQNRGEQRLYLQFAAAGKVHQAAFTVFVT
jgi:hypothetical protein